LSQITLSTSKIKNWLEKETNHFLIPIQKEAQKNQEQIQQIKESIQEITNVLLDISQKEIEKRNMRILNRARALNKLSHIFSDRINKIKLTEEISYATLSKITQETNKILLVNEVDIKNWFPRISPFFIRDRRKFIAVHEKAKETLSEVSDFVKNEYIKTKTLQETFQLIFELKNLENKLDEVALERKEIEKDQIAISTKLADLTNQINSLQEKDTLNQLSQVDIEIENLTNEVNHAFRRLNKPLKKMQALTLRDSSARLSSEEIAALENYNENPFNAITQEKPNYPILKQILKTLKMLLETGKLKLKSDKKRKAQQTIKKINNNSLTTLQQQSIQKIKQKQQLLTSTTLAEITNKKKQFQEQNRKIQAKKARIDAHALVKENKYNRIKNQINEHKRLIEKNIKESIEKTIKIE
jgi:hypothetical protein